jgi:hypothetical protein
MATQNTYVQNFVRRNPVLTKDDNKFLEWMQKVEEFVVGTIGFHLLDLPDEQYRENYSSGMHYKRMACHVVQSFNSSFGI